MSRCRTSLAWAWSSASAACLASRATSRACKGPWVESGVGMPPLAGVGLGVRQIVAPQLADDPRQVAAVDEPHRVIGHPLGRSGGEDRHDVRMVQAGGGLRLDLEPLEMPGVERRGIGQDLQGDPPAERDLDGLVDDAHAAAAHLADQPEVIQVAQLGELARRGRQVGHHLDRRQELAKGVGIPGVVLRADLLAPSQPLADLGDQLRELGVVRFGDDRLIAHGTDPESSALRTERIFSMARRCRILAALSPISRIAAISGKVRSSR